MSRIRRGRPRVERVQLVCSGCGVAFERRPNEVRTERVFCSGTCARSTGLRPRTGFERKCPQCGNGFYVEPRSQRQFCGKVCADKAVSKSVLKQCEQCGVEFPVPPSAAHRRFCSKPCEGLSRTKRMTGRVHNGRPVILNTMGYVLLWEPTHPAAMRGGRVLEHRWVMEKKLGRFLTTDEHVNHINAVKDDNRPENLEIVSNAQHGTITGRQVADARRALADELAEYRRRFGPLPKE